MQTDNRFYFAPSLRGGAEDGMMTDALGGFSSILVIPPFILTLYLNCPAFEYESNDLMVRIYFGALDLCPITEPHQGRLLLGRDRHGSLRPHGRNGPGTRTHSWTAHRPHRPPAHRAVWKNPLEDPTSSFLLLLVRHLLVVAMHLLLIASCYY